MQNVSSPETIQITDSRYTDYKSPYPYFGGKSTVADVIWDRFGADVANFVDPFFGSNAVLLGRPGWHPGQTYFETLNDKSAYIANFWRAIMYDPEQTAFYADWPSNENDLHARHIWLVNEKESLRDRVEGDPEFFDAKVAGWWVWGMANWLGSGFCEGKGPWNVQDGILVRADRKGVKRIIPSLGHSGQVVERRIVHFGDKGRGINRQMVHLGNRGINRQMVHLGNRGINRQSVFFGDSDNCNPNNGACGIYNWFGALSERLRRVHIASGDWKRVLAPTPTIHLGTTAVLLDPPYAGSAGRDKNLYEHEDLNIAHDVRKWALENGDSPMFRIAVCGYESEDYNFPSTWESYAWKAKGGFGNQRGKRGKDNANRERIWFSPHCNKPKAGWIARSFFE